MRATSRTYVGAHALVRELARAGVRHACVSPGSRSTPLALALAAEAGIRVWSHVDERSGAFFALGLAKASRTPVVFACTSGTAAANALPAVVEAWHARVPLLLLTADRPPELREVGAGQTIDQIRLFGSHVRWFVEVGTPEASRDWVRWARTLAARAVARSMEPPAGPVHLNCAFREPLTPDGAEDDPAVPCDDDPRSRVAATQEASDLAPHVRIHAACPAPEPGAVDETAAVLARAVHPLVVAGPMDAADAGLPAAVADLAGALGAPLLAEVASNLRTPDTAAVLVDAHDVLMRNHTFAGAHPPDGVVRLGAPPTSKVTTTWLARQEGIPHVLLGADLHWADPAGVATHALGGDATAACRALAAAVRRRRAARATHVVAATSDASATNDTPATSDASATADAPAPSAPPPSGWRAAWREAGAAARRRLDVAVRAEAEAFEAHAVLALAAALPPEAQVYLGNSLAIRDADWFWPAGGPTARVLANRGANGIDGFVSSVLGAAAADPARPTIGLCGDLSFYHDLNGLLAVRRHGVRAVFLVLDNDGGGIFDHLPVARQPAAVYEPLFVTPHGIDFAPIVRAYGAAFAAVDHPEAIAPALAAALTAPCTTVVALRFTRAHSRAAHARVFARAAEAAP